MGKKKSSKKVIPSLQKEYKRKRDEMETEKLSMKKKMKLSHSSSSLNTYHTEEIPQQIEVKGDGSKLIGSIHALIKYIRQVHNQSNLTVK